MKDSFEGGTKYSSNIGGNLGLYYDRLRRIFSRITGDHMK